MFADYIVNTAKHHGMPNLQETITSSTSEIADLPQVSMLTIVNNIRIPYLRLQQSQYSANYNDPNLLNKLKDNNKNMPFKNIERYIKVYQLSNVLYSTKQFQNTDEHV